MGENWFQLSTCNEKVGEDGSPSTSEDLYFFFLMFSFFFSFFFFSIIVYMDVGRICALDHVCFDDHYCNMFFGLQIFGRF